MAPRGMPVGFLFGFDFTSSFTGNEPFLTRAREPSGSWNEVLPVFTRRVVAGTVSIFRGSLKTERTGKSEKVSEGTLLRVTFFTVHLLTFVLRIGDLLTLFVPALTVVFTFFTVFFITPVFFLGAAHLANCASVIF